MLNVFVIMSRCIVVVLSDQLGACTTVVLAGFKEGILARQVASVEDEVCWGASLLSIVLDLCLKWCKSQSSKPFHCGVITLTVVTMCVGHNFHVNISSGY